MKRMLLLPALAGALLTMTACGGGSDSAQSAAPQIVVEGGQAAADPATADTATAVAVGAGGTTDTVAVAATGTDEEKALAFAKCMRESGVDDFPDPTVNADGSVDFGVGPGGGGGAGGGRPPAFLDDPDLNKAFDSCGKLAEGASFLPTAQDQTALQDNLLEAAKCLREQGIDVQDPDFSNGATPGAGVFGDGFDPNDPKNAAAVDACSDVFSNLQPAG